MFSSIGVAQAFKGVLWLVLVTALPHSTATPAEPCVTISRHPPPTLLHREFRTEALSDKKQARKALPYVNVHIQKVRTGVLCHPLHRIYQCSLHSCDISLVVCRQPA